MCCVPDFSRAAGKRSMLGWRLRTQGLIMQFSPQGTNIKQSIIVPKPGITAEKTGHKTIVREKS